MNTLAPTVSWELDEADAMQGLTTRQYKFVTLMFQGLNDTEAYRQAGYGSGMNAQSLGQAAHHAAKNPKVQAKLRELRERVDEQSTLAPSLSREWILDGIMGRQETIARGGVIEVTIEPLWVGRLEKMAKLANVTPQLYLDRLLARAWAGMPTRSRVGG